MGTVAGWRIESTIIVGKECNMDVKYFRHLVLAVFQTPPPQSLNGLSFSRVHEVLVQGQNPRNAPTLVEHVNAEANIIMALICHADGNKPANACNRPVIKAILKHVK
ncbi:MAG TPA: hypothetical protein VF221_23040 [Chloroflexota bacterium]